jgi:hypothetical protein
MLLVSAMHQDHSERIEELTPVGAHPNLGRTGAGDFIARIIETQYLARVGDATFMAGAGHYSGRDKVDIDVFIIIPPITLVEIEDRQDTRHANYYLYSLVPVACNLDLTIGAIFDQARNDTIGDRNEFNPKFGAIWDVGRSTSLRVAALRTMNRSVVSNQSIEPTQVAGFQQFFQDLGMAKSELYGLSGYGQDCRTHRSIVPCGKILQLHNIAAMVAGGTPANIPTAGYIGGAVEGRLSHQYFE